MNALPFILDHHQLLHHHCFQRRQFKIFITAVKPHDPSCIIFKVLTKVQLTLAEWLLFVTDPCPLEDIFQRQFIPLDCEFLVAKWLKNGSVQLKEVYHISPKFALEQHSVGYWSHQHGLQWRTIGFYNRRKNLRGLELLIAVSEVSFLARTIFKNLTVTNRVKR